MFVDFRKVHDNVYRESLYNIMEEFRIINKLVITLPKYVCEGWNIK